MTISSCTSYWNDTTAANKAQKQGIAISLATVAVLVSTVTVLFFTATPFINFARSFPPDTFWSLYTLSALTVLSIPIFLFIRTFCCKKDSTKLPLIPKNPITPIDPELVDLLAPSPFSNQRVASVATIHEGEHFPFNSLPTELQLKVLKTLDAKSLSQFALTSWRKFGLVHPEFSLEIKKTRLEEAALRLWQYSLLSDFDTHFNKENHTIAKTIELLIPHTDFILNQIRVALKSIDRIPHKNAVLYKVSDTLHGMVCANSKKVIPVVVQLLDCASDMRNDGKINEIEEQEIIFNCMKPLCHDMSLAVEYFSRLKPQFQASAACLFDELDAQTKVEDELKHFSEVDDVREKGFLLCDIVANSRQRGKDKILQAIEFALSNLHAIHDQLQGDVLVELAVSYLTIDDFDSACKLAKKQHPELKTRIYKAIADHCDPGSAKAYQYLSKLLVKANFTTGKKYRLHRQSEKETLIAIAIKMAEIKPEEAVSILKEVHQLFYDKDGHVFVKMTECLLSTDLERAHTIAKEIKEPRCKSEALVLVATKLIESDHKQAEQIFEAAFAECSNLPTQPTSYLETEFMLTFNKILAIVNVAEHYAPIRPQRAKEMLQVALEETKQPRYRATVGVAFALARAYAAISVKECIQYVKEGKIQEFKSFLLAKTANDLKI